MKETFISQVKKITEMDSRYKPDAYEFLMESLWFTQERLKRKGHVNGRELLEGLRECVLEQYGPMAKTVLEHWGVRTTEDIGEIVFNMVEAGLLSKTDKDTREDFKQVFKFDEALDVFRNVDKPESVR